MCELTHANEKCVNHAEGNRFKSDPGQCVASLEKLLTLNCSTLMILHFANNLTCANYHVVIIKMDIVLQNCNFAAHIIQTGVSCKYRV